MGNQGTGGTISAIGPATPADVDRIAQLFHDDMVDLGQTPDIEALRETTRAAMDPARSRCHLWVVRDADGVAVGVILASEFMSIKFPGPGLWIEELYVTPAYRRGGIGRRLVDTFLEWAWRQGYRGVELEAYRMNTAASILYRSLGFRRLARERYSFDFSEVDLEETP